MRVVRACDLSQLAMAKGSEIGSRFRVALRSLAPTQFQQHQSSVARFHSEHRAKGPSGRKPTRP